MVSAVVLSLVSIFLSYLAFVVGVLFWVSDCFQSKKIRLEAPPFTPILLVFLGLVIVSIAFSSDPLSSALYLKKLIKVFGIFLIYTYVTERQIERGLRWIFWTLGMSGAYGILQIWWLKDIDLLNRIDGFMSHWMTYSGQLTIGAVSLAGYLLFLIRTRSGRSWSSILLYALIFVVVVTALVLTFTRSAWIGTVCGLLITLAILKVRWALCGGIVVFMVFLLLPTSLQERFYSSFDPSDTTTRGRIELLKTGSKLIQANPWTGVGPRMVSKRALDYREEKELPSYLYQHFHNNLLQIAAEMGIPAALVWLALWIWMVSDFLRLRTRGREFPFLDYLAVNGISVLGAVQLAGLLEYNFGDAEIAILLFFIVIVPYTVDRRSVHNGA